MTGEEKQLLTTTTIVMTTLNSLPVTGTGSPTILAGCQNTLCPSTGEDDDVNSWLISDHNVNDVKLKAFLILI